jgi:hypothetical protein
MYTKREVQKVRVIQRMEWLFRFNIVRTSSRSAV